jgi:hypothetical protein
VTASLNNQHTTVTKLNSKRSESFAAFIASSYKIQVERFEFCCRSIVTGLRSNNAYSVVERVTRTSIRNHNIRMTMFFFFKMTVVYRHIIRSRSIHEYNQQAKLNTTFYMRWSSLNACIACIVIESHNVTFFSAC